MVTTPWEGVKGSTEHRSTGQRARCFQDNEWCYENILCPCCMEASDNYTVCETCEGTGYVPKAPV